MASLEIDPASGRYRVRFRYAGQEYKRSLRTKSQPVAQASLGQVEEALRMIEMGLVELPSDVEEGAFIVSGARVRKARRQASKVRTLDDLFRVYQAELPPGSKEPRTLAGERLHFKHLLRHLKPKTRLAAITPRTVQSYVELRSKDRYAKRSITPDTIKKEITTLRLVWNWAKRQEYVDNSPPVSHVVYPKRDEKPPFQTLSEIQRAVGEGKLSRVQEATLWESLFLTRPEVDRLLDHVAKQSASPFVYPMFVLVAHTGMRRSELLRAEKADFDFEGRRILVREKKRSRKHALSYRRVPMTNRLGRVFKEYFADHPSGPFALTREDDLPLTTDAADYFFEATLKGSVWQKLRGFHVFRHSFASNAMAEGIDQRMIDTWMGHQTEEMRQRYCHLAPTQQHAAIDAVYRDKSASSDATT